MALFNLLKTKDKLTDAPVQSKTERAECDITKTQVMVDLFQIPQEKRDEEWKQAFYDNVPSASYSCGNPQIFTGPDGFPYFALKTPEANQPFESFCIKNMKDDFLLERGYGVTINPKENGVDWVFTYGDIVNLHLNNEFYTKKNSAELENVEIIKAGEKVLLAQPSEKYLPKQTREVLKSFLQHIGITQPKIMMLCRTIQATVIQELAFNIFPEDFPSVEQLNHRLQQISWFLPGHYSIVALEKKSTLINNFMDL